MDVTELCELSSETNGAKILFSSDDFFGVAENLIKEVEPNINTVKVTYKPDAWLTRRIRKTVYACAIIQLAARAEIHFICIDTASLVGDVAVLFSVQAKSLVIDHEVYQNRSNRVGTRANVDEWRRIAELLPQTWPHLISWQSLNPGYPSMNKKFFIIPSTGQDYTHLKLNIYPDGGISRLRVYGKVLGSIPVPPLWESPIDLVSKIYGGNCIAYSSCYNNTHPNNLIKPTDSVCKKDGWQTMRNFIRSTAGFSHRVVTPQFNQIIGEEWAVFQLGYSGKITAILINTVGGEGNSPYIARVQGLREGIIINDRTDICNKPWLDIVPFARVNEGSNQQFIIENENRNIKMAYVKLTIKPDGCVSRFRVLGEI